MKFLIDSMLPPLVAEHLEASGHGATTPSKLGAHSLPDAALIEVATVERMVIVTENASDFASVSSCPVLLVRKSWWPSRSLPERLAASVARWALAYPDPGQWAHWMPAELR